MHVPHYLQLVIIFGLTSCAPAARILAVLPYAFRSHQSFHQAVLKTLAHRGHQVVVYSPFPQPQPLPNYTDVFVNTSYTDDWITYDLVLDIFRESPTKQARMVWDNFNIFLEDSLSHENIQKLARSDEKFDLVIVEAFMTQEALLVFGHKFHAPTIALQPMNTYIPINRVMGNSLSLSYIPVDFNLPFTDQMALYERFVNVYAFSTLMKSYYNEELPLQQAMLERHLKFLNAPPLQEMVHNISLIFLNAHPTVRYAQPYSPNMIPVGGIHVSTQRKPLPQHIQQFMDEAKHGVIYFSFGTCVPEHRLPSDLNQVFVRVFKKMKQRVLWKTRAADNITGLPENVMVVKWAPQQDILAHPNCVLFFTHGGLLSQLEVFYAGVPVVGVPFFADQPLNVRYYEHKGVGLHLDFFDLNEETIYKTLNTVLNNPRYKENAMEVSKIFKDLPMTQADSAVYWVEHVLRHKGAHQLRPASARMAWYQLALLDVLASVLLAVLTVFVVFYLACTRTYKFLKYFSSKELNVKKNA